ncbi:SDR family oxidoreductase [Peribacillus glennii]|uniref:SDR family oxidoreductase n=1 Tax=Peribacillus glennii TaxID=2303991 RepID=UPI002695A609|nr:SDR family oxidoreductase [Peribacillus glennii]
MGRVYFFTGFPGFICNQLIRELLQRDGRFARAYFLVLPSQRQKADRIHDTRGRYYESGTAILGRSE